MNFNDVHDEHYEQIYVNNGVPLYLKLIQSNSISVFILI